MFVAVQLYWPLVYTAGLVVMLYTADLLFVIQLMIDVLFQKFG